MIDAMDQFTARVLKLRIGETFVYHRGYLVKDRERRSQLSTMAKTAYGLYLAGAAVLTQKRLDSDLYEYQLRVTRAVRNVDLERALKLWDENYVEVH